MRTGRVPEKFPQIVARLTGMLARSTTMLDRVDVSLLPDGFLDELPQPAQIGATRVGGIDVNTTRIRAMLDAVLALAVAPENFTVAAACRADLPRSVNASEAPRPYFQ